jgi:hypothetical protein
MEMPYIYSWKEYTSLPDIRTMLLQEQIRRYNYYICEMDQLLMHIINCNKGGRGNVPDGFLQQEDLFYILQEDGSFINVTT